MCTCSLALGGKPDAERMARVAVPASGLPGVPLPVALTTEREPKLVARWWGEVGVKGGAGFALPETSRWGVSMEGMADRLSPLVICGVSSGGDSR